MAFRCLNVLRIVRSNSIIHSNLISSTIKLPKGTVVNKPKEYTTENDLVYLEEADTFGTLSRKVQTDLNALEDEGDIKEERYIREWPMQSQKLTIKQYADLIKQYVEHKRIKEAIDILEVRMLTEDRVKPENYIYNILIGACADVGYTKKAFKLYNDMKRRALKPTGDTYTCLFHACANSPWAIDGLKHAHNLRTLMIEKAIEPNVTNYNSMIKAFGRCGDLLTAFKIADEMVGKKIKIRVHTFNHLLQACISDKISGLRHALVVWRKMLKVREKPNIYSFNLMLKCVKDCDLGSKEDIEELIDIIQDHLRVNQINKQDIFFNINKPLQIEESQFKITSDIQENLSQSFVSEKITKNEEESLINAHKEINVSNANQEGSNVAVFESKNNISIQLVDKIKKPIVVERTVPNLLSKVLKMENVLSLKEVNTRQDKFAVIGGQDDFLKEMESYSVKPDIKTFTQMLPLIEETKEAENKLIETMKSLDVKADIDFYNMLIKKRCLRFDYEDAFDVKQMIDQESKYRRKNYPLKKKLRLKINIMTYGVLSLACKTRESAEKLLNEMKEDQLKVNMEILGTLLRQGTTANDFPYVLYIMNVTKEENIPPNNVFFKHLETFNDKCTNVIKKSENGEAKCSEGFLRGYKKFYNTYTNWLKEINIEEVLQQEHPWKQFRENYPETLQRQKIKIKEPKRFYKRNRKYVPYTPNVS